MELTEANQLLDPGFLPLEAGYTRLGNGQLHVAARTTMNGCTGRMVDWWFGFIESTDHYKSWHPVDHIWSDWEGERGTGRYIGGTHLVHETIGGQLNKIRINFRDPSLILDTSRFLESGVSAAIYGRVGLLEEPVWAGHVIHLCRDTANGCEMRSRFWLGDMDPPELAPNPEARIALFPDEVGQALLKHCIEEMEFLSICLPDLYAGHTT